MASVYVMLLATSPQPEDPSCSGLFLVLPVPGLACAQASLCSTFFEPKNRNLLGVQKG